MPLLSKSAVQNAMLVPAVFNNTIFNPRCDQVISEYRIFEEIKLFLLHSVKLKY